MLKKKILVILSSEYYNKYFNLNSFQKLDKKYDLIFALKKKIFKKKNKFKLYKLDRNNKYIIRYLKLIKLRSLRKIPSLYTSLQFSFPSYKTYKSLFFQKDHKFPFLFYIKNYFFINILFKILSNFPFFQFYKKFLFLKIKNKSEIDTLIENIKPDLIIYPTHFMEPEMIYINRSALINNSKTFYIVDNWDNLTTKVAMLQKANYLGVWGQQSKEHAIKYHNYNSKNIFLLGNNRINKYFQFRKKKYKNTIKINKPYILFLGSNLLPREELKCLKILDKKIDENNLNSKLKIIYRFHPQLSKYIRMEFTNIKFKNIKINIPSSKLALTDRNLVRSKTQSKDYFPLIQNAKSLMGLTITTVTLEGFIFGKNYIILDCIDKEDAHISNFLKKYSEHPKGIEKIKICKIVKTYEEFFRFIKKNNKKVDQKKIDKQLNFFYYNQSTDYQLKIKQCVDKIFSKDF